MGLRHPRHSSLGLFALALGLMLAMVPTASAQTPIPQGGWTLLAVDSAGPGFPGTYAFDGNGGTAWTTSWTPSVAPLPHDIDINLGAVYDLQGFRHLPRQDGSAIGRIGQYEFYVTTNLSDWGAPVAQGFMPNVATQTEIPFPLKTGRYVRLKVLSSLAGSPYTTLAELNVLRVNAPTPILTSVTPNSGALGTKFSILLKGSNTNFSTGASVITFSGTGVTAVPPQQAIFGTDLYTYVEVTAGAALGPRTVTVTTGGEVVSLPDGFTVVATAGPCFDNGGGRFKNCGNGTVTDQTTGLIWLKDAACASLTFGTAGGAVSWLDANLSVTGLENGACGLSDGSKRGDWRLPTFDEWSVALARARAVCPGNGNPVWSNDAGTGCWDPPSPPGSSFSGVTANYYWSGSSSENVANFAYVGDLNQGNDSVAVVKTGLVRVWPVRGGPR